MFATLKEKRQELGLSLIQLSQATGIDQGLLSKYENEKRLPSDKHIVLLAQALGIPFSKLHKLYLSEKIAQLVKYETDYSDILALAESRIAYLSSGQTFTDPKLSSDVSRTLSEIDKLRAKWTNKKPLNATQLIKMREYFKIKYTYDSNQIEGNTLTYQETSLVVNEGITIGGKSMREHLEAINHAEAVDFIVDLIAGKEELTQRSLLDVHRLILKSIDQHNAGSYRTVPVRITGSKHVPPQPFQLGKLMEDYFFHYNQQKRTLHPVILAAEMHERLLSIHPFVDGNGRTSRLVMNFILLKNGYTVTSLKGDTVSRLAYYEALQKVQKDNDPESFYKLITERVHASLEEHLSLV